MLRDFGVSPPSDPALPCLAMMVCGRGGGEGLVELAPSMEDVDNAPEMTTEGAVPGVLGAKNAVGGDVDLCGEYNWVCCCFCA